MNRFRLYNLYPLLYTNFAEMKADIDRVHGLGFTDIWVNPLFETSQTPSPLNEKTDSLYGHKSFRLSERYRDPANKSLEEDSAQIRDFTDHARSHGMSSYIDVVFLHVAHDHALISNDHTAFKECPVLSRIPDHIDTSRWFLATANAMGDDVWDDVQPFNFDDPEIRTEILEYYLKPYIGLVVRDWGFDGLRVDSAPYILPEVYHELMDYAGEISQQERGRQILRLPETVSDKKPQEYTPLKGNADACYSSAHWVLLKDFAKWHIDGTNHSVQIIDPVLAAKSMVDTDEKKRRIYSHFANVLNDDHGELARNVGFLRGNVAPVCGFADNHDTASVTDIFTKMGFDHDDVAQLSRLFMTIMAFAHDGWFLTTGSEYYKESNSVFHASQDDISDHLDNTDFVRSVNATLGTMPDIREEWTQTLFDPENPNVIVFIHRAGGGFDAKPDIVVVNTSDTEKVVDYDFVVHMLEMSVERHPNQDHDAVNKDVGSIHLCGALSPDVSLIDMNVTCNGQTKPRHVDLQSESCKSPHVFSPALV